MGQGNVHALVPREAVALDPVQLGDLMARMAGKHGATVVGNVLDDLALRLSQIGPAWRDGRMDQVMDCCREVAEIGVSLELDRLARVARTALMLASKGDGVALAANLGRLMRLGEAVLTSVWDLQDASV